MSAANTLRILAVIPSRLASTRLPEKPLKDIAGHSLVQRVWDQAMNTSCITYCAVATDSEVIFKHVESFGGKAVMTSGEYQTGSERVYGAAQLLAKQHFPEEAARVSKPETLWDVVLNVQGDMPFVPPKAIERLVSFLLDNRETYSMATIATPITDEERFLAPSVVKVVVSAKSEGLYFSRAPIPFPRSEQQKKTYRSPANGEIVYGLKHVGLYAFLPAGLQAYDSPEISPIEDVEKLEQLRVMERGERIGVVILDEELMRNSVEVDTPEDLARAASIATGV
jgi:3-deoxy-manno-octulosonate cytidylyltransferase (CMP-KDO synthetase)